MFPVETSINVLWSGKFTSLSDEWVHMTRQIFEYEIFFVTEGTLYIASEDKKNKVGENEYLLMPPTRKQYGYAPSQCSFYWMHFSVDGDFIEESEEDSIPHQGVVPNMNRIIILINQLQDVARRYHHQHTMNLLASGILLELYNQRQLGNKKSYLSSKAKIYESVLNYVAWNRYQRNSISEIAEYLGYHEKYVSAIFKEQAGISLKRYLLQEVMECAKAEMMDTKKTIAQIAYSIGYTDAHNFSHSFKNVVGISPKEYRNSCVRAAKIH